MEQFSLLKYLLKPKRKRKIMTRVGDSVRILSHNLKGDKPVVAVIDEGNSNQILSFTKDGKYLLNGNDSEYDLYFVTGKKVGWINIYQTDVYYAGCCIYSSKEEAIKVGRQSKDYLMTIRVGLKD